MTCLNPKFVTSFCLSAATLGGTASAQFAVDPAVNYAAGSQPSGVATADFDGDGDMDLATTVDGPDRVVILLNGGAGTYTPGPVSFLPNSSSPQDLVAGDLDGDGDADLAIAVRDPSGGVLIMANNGAASFAMTGTTITGDRPRGLAIADYDGDNDLDLAVANRDSLSASVLTNNGAGVFSAATLNAGGETRATAFFDMDGDNDLDLAVTDSDNRQVDLYTNTGGTFTASGSLSVGPFVRPDGIASADVDADGDADLVVATSDDTFAIYQATVFLNTVTDFSGPFNYPTGGVNPSGIRTADFDCDGMIDIAAVNQDSNNMSLLRNTGAGVYGAPQLLATGTRPGEIVTGDLDADGDADIAVANRDSNNLSVFINQTCSAVVPGDSNGDGVVNFADIIAVLGAWGDCPGCPEDLNGDGVVSFADILVILGNWTV